MLQRIRDAKKNQSGFTLIELLIVIVILGVLAAVVVLAVGAFNNNGKSAACQSDFKSYEIADEAYYAKSAVPGPPAYAASAALLMPTFLKELHTDGANGYTLTSTATGGVQVSVNGGAPSNLISTCSTLG
jgi:prepilin-type N-terminal cleavage/methylation domain-containing protein